MRQALGESGGLSFWREDWATYRAEVGPLWPRHWEDLYGQGRLPEEDQAFPLDVDDAYYEGVDRAGMLCVVTARAEGKLVGYFVAMIVMLSQFKTVKAGIEDTYWLASEHRRGRNGLRLIMAMEEALKAEGCRKVIFFSNECRPIDKIFARMGYRRAHVAFTKWLGR